MQRLDCCAESCFPKYTKTFIKTPLECKAVLWKPSQVLVRRGQHTTLPVTQQNQHCPTQPAHFKTTCIQGDILKKEAIRVFVAGYLCNIAPRGSFSSRFSDLGCWERKLGIWTVYWVGLIKYDMDTGVGYFLVAITLTATLTERSEGENMIPSSVNLWLNTKRQYQDTAIHTGRYRHSNIGKCTVDTLRLSNILLMIS